MNPATTMAAPESGTTEKKRRILIIEDEKALADGVAYNLRREGFEVLHSMDGREGLAKAREVLPDYILLDLMLPGMAGTEVLRELKVAAATSGIPVIILSAKSEETDQVVGFTLGADDYVTKPFSVKVLIQRIKVLDRRREAAAEVGGSDDSIIQHRGVRIDRVRHRGFVNDAELELTPTEFRLLETLLRKPGRAFSRKALMSTAIGEDAVVLDRTIDVHIKTLRRKLGNPELIETVRGLGYRFQE